MDYPKLRPLPRRRARIDSFPGYDRRPNAPAGAFREMQNLSGERFPHLSVCPRRDPVPLLEGCPADHVMALGGSGTPVLLDISGSLWAGGHCLPRLLAGRTSVSVSAVSAGQQVASCDPEAIRACIANDGDYLLVYDQEEMVWRVPDRPYVIPHDDLLLHPIQSDGVQARLMLSTTLEYRGERQLCFLGAWVCVFPDGKFANTVKLAEGQTMIRDTDYGDIAQSNLSDYGNAVFSPCGEDGTVRALTVDAQAPDSGYWVDPTEPEPEVKYWSAAQNAWVAAVPYVRCAMPGIAKGIASGDGVELFCRLDSHTSDYAQVEALWEGAHLITAAYHDPGESGRPEGMGDYVVFPGLLEQEVTVAMSAGSRSFFQLERRLPEMDFVVSCQNRLWGCRRSGAVNELYGSKLGDFRNWSVFEGLSTDSYRVSRGEDGPFTGAAVLGGCPLFFRENSLEKIYPSAAGDHGVVTRNLPGVEQGSHRSLTVIQDKLYYKSPGGVCRYDGTLPVVISQALGTEEPYRRGVSGARGHLLIICLETERGIPFLFAYDTRCGRWYRLAEDAMVVTWSQGERLYFTRARNGDLYCMGLTEDCEGVYWYAETGELAPTPGARRYLTRLQLTARLEQGAEMQIYLSYDGGPWLYKGSFYGNDWHSLTLPVRPRRADRVRLRIQGRGGMELERLSCLVELGSDEA